MYRKVPRIARAALAAAIAMNSLPTLASDPEAARLREEGEGLVLEDFKKFALRGNVVDLAVGGDRARPVGVDVHPELLAAPLGPGAMRLGAGVADRARDRAGEAAAHAGAPGAGRGSICMMLTSIPSGS